MIPESQMIYLLCEFDKRQDEKFYEFGAERIKVFEREPNCDEYTTELGVTIPS